MSILRDLRKEHQGRWPITLLANISLIVHIKIIVMYANIVSWCIIYIYKCMCQPLNLSIFLTLNTTSVD
jgi:SNF family Na+-dependent transporter